MKEGDADADHDTNTDGDADADQKDDGNDDVLCLSLRECLLCQN